MAKKRNQKKNQLSLNVDAEPRAVAVEPESLQAQCELTIKRALGRKDVGFDTPERAADNRLLYKLKGDRATKAEAKRPYTVVPFVTLPEHLFWLAVWIEFIFEAGAYRLIGINLVFFEGGAYDEKKNPLLRAEWAFVHDAVREPHAQPHWHVYNTALGTVFGDQRRPQFEPENTIQDFEPAESLLTDFETDKTVEEASSAWGWDAKAGFHYAMAARWHLEGDDAHQTNIEPDILANWIQGCLLYTQQQIMFLYG